MISSVQLNRNYAIYLSDLYGGTKNNVQVVGITSIDSLAKNNPDYNITINKEIIIKWSNQKQTRSMLPNTSSTLTLS